MYGFFGFGFNLKNYGFNSFDLWGRSKNYTDKVNLKWLTDGFVINLNTENQNRDSSRYGCFWSGELGKTTTKSTP